MELTPHIIVLRKYVEDEDSIELYEDVTEIEFMALTDAELEKLDRDKLTQAQQTALMVLKVAGFSPAVRMRTAILSSVIIGSRGRQIRP